MVIPLVNEIEWAHRLHGLPEWQPDCAPTVIVVPHPDDETLAAGGLIAALRARGAEVTVVAVTDGENAYRNNAGLARIREREQTRALAKLGVSPDKILRLGFVDSSIASEEQALAARLRPVINAQTQVFAPWRGDFHPDHEACARAAEMAAREVGATLVSYFFWTWHRGTPTTVDGLTLRKFVLTDAMRSAKRDALACHQSQLSHAPEPEILPDELLWPARMDFEVFAL